VRENVNGAIEFVRQQKQVGTSLEAQVHVRAGGESYRLLDRYRADLPMLFIVSKVVLEQDPSGADELAVTVSRADGIRCVRCWRYVPEVAQDEVHAGLCDRCLDAVGGDSAARDIA
jgi:isoleucyl-tRNA synthetase